MLGLPLLLLCSCSSFAQNEAALLQRAADELAAGLTQSLENSPLVREKIGDLGPVVLPAIEGDTGSHLRTRLAEGLTNSMSLPVASEVPELARIKQKFFLDLPGLRAEFEQLKKDGKFHDARSALMAAVSFYPGQAGSTVTVDARLIDLEHGVSLWSGSATRYVLDPDRDLKDLPEAALVDLVERDVPLLGAERKAVRARLAGLADARSEEALRRDKERWAYEQDLRTEQGRRTALVKYGLLAFVIALGAVVLASQIRVQRIRVEARQLGGTGLARREARKHDRDLVVEGARRVRSLLSLLHSAGMGAAPGTRESMQRLVPDLEGLARELEGAPSGSFHGPVERKAAKDEALAGLRNVEAHDRAVLGLIEEVDLTVSSMVRLVQGNATVPEAMVQEAQALAARLRRRLGERAALIRAGRA